MTTDDGDLLVCRIGTFDLGDEARGTNDIKSGNTKETFWIVNTFRLVNLGADWDSGVDLKDNIESTINTRG